MLQRSCHASFLSISICYLTIQRKFEKLKDFQTVAFRQMNLYKNQPDNNYPAEKLRQFLIICFLLPAFSLHEPYMKVRIS